MVKVLLAVYISEKYLNSEFITLNPFVYIAEHVDNGLQCLILNKIKTGTSKVQITINKKNIKTIEMVVLD